MQRDAGLECDDEVYLDSFRPTLMDVFYDWSLGKSFAEVGETPLRMLCHHGRQPNTACDSAPYAFCTAAMCA